MVKFCPNCGKDNLENDLFCTECGTPMPEKPQTNPTSPINAQSYQSFESETTPHRKTKLLITIGVIVIVAILIGASFYVLVYSNGNAPEITKYYLRNDGPKLNLQSSLTGSISPIVEQGYFATYAYYYQDQKIGTASVENVGQETFQGISCSKIKTSGDMDMVIDANPVKCTFESFEYRKLEDNMPYYMLVNFQYSKPSSFTMSTNYQWDRQNNKMEYTVSVSGQQSNFECTLPDEYWSLFDSSSLLQIGFSKELKYTMNAGALGSVEVTMTVQILEQEDISVQNGDYEDCYKIEIYQTYELLGNNYSNTFIFWVNDQGIMPQAETTTSSGGIITTLLMKLDEYYTKTPPQL